MEQALYIYLKIPQDSNLSSYRSIHALQIKGNNPLNIDSVVIEIGIFEEDGCFRINYEGLFINGFLIKAFKLEKDLREIREMGYDNILHIDYGQRGVSSKAGTLKFVIRSGTHSSLVSQLKQLIEKLFPIIHKNHDIIIQKRFVEEPLSLKKLYPVVTNYIIKVGESKCTKIESSKYVPAKENKFYTHINIEYITFIDKYFKKLLTDFCFQQMKKQGVWNGNNFTYLDKYDSAWSRDYDEVISEYSWQIEKAEFIAYICRKFDESEYFITTLLN